MFLRFKTFIFFTLALFSVTAALAQETTDKKPTPSPTPADLNKGAVTAEGVAELAIYLYGGGGGRQNLNQIRKTMFERGKITILNAEGQTEKANYERWVLRGDALDKERIRFNQEYPGSRYALIFTGEKIFGIYNEGIFEPRPEIMNSFQNQIWHGLEALLRYKENGSTLALDGKEKVMGVEFHRLDVTDKQNRKTRFFISTKSFRVMHLEYTANNVKHLRKFYDYNYAQGTLFPFRTVLWAGDKQIEETEVQTVSFGMKIEESIFQAAG